MLFQNEPLSDVKNDTVSSNFHTVSDFFVHKLASFFNSVLVVYKKEKEARLSNSNNHLLHLLKRDFSTISMARLY